MREPAKSVPTTIPLAMSDDESATVASNVGSPVPQAFTPGEDDCRLYHPDADGWAAHIQKGTDRQYCYVKSPGQDFFHLIVPGEIFVQKGDEKLCLMCAVREGILTTNRLFWQYPWRKESPSGTPT